MCVYVRRVTLCVVSDFRFIRRCRSGRGDSSCAVYALSFFFQAEDGIRDLTVTGVQTCVFFFQAEDGIRDLTVTGVQTCALPILILGHLLHAHTEYQWVWQSRQMPQDYGTERNLPPTASGCVRIA